jgi:hypothetical protein
MNLTSDYYDPLDGDDGDHLACKPGNVAEGFEVVCNFGMPIVGSLQLLNGLSFILLVYIRRRNKKLLARQTRDGLEIPNVINSSNTNPQIDALSYAEHLLLTCGVCVIGLSLMFFVYGWGTMYPTTHIRGQIGDLVGKK